MAVNPLRRTRTKAPSGSPASAHSTMQPVEEILLRRVVHERLHERHSAASSAANLNASRFSIPFPLPLALLLEVRRFHQSCVNGPISKIDRAPTTGAFRVGLRGVKALRA